MVAGNSVRRITSGGGNNTGEDIRALRTSGNAPNFLRVVVVDVFFDPLLLTEAQKINLINLVGNPETINVLPRDSILGRIITGGQDLSDSTPRIFYPFTPPHMRPPVKPGEHVWVLYEDPANMNEKGYWLWRITEDMTVDDVNYTHSDRRLDPLNNPLNITNDLQMEISRQDRTNISPTPTFPNGGGQNGIYTLSQTSNVNPYQEIFEDATANSEVTYEATPRFTKRPGDLALLGSNNTRLCLGEDRTATAKRAVSTPDKRTQAGAIDLVAGVGRVLPSNEQTNPGQAETSPNAPRIIQNERSKIETDKTPYLHGATDNALEGDPNFQKDVSRIYVAQKTDGDTNFNVAASWPTAFASPIQAIPEKGYIVLKSDQIRILARKEQNGSIRITKEGSGGASGDACSVFFLNDGTVQLDGNKIFIGRAGGRGPGPNGSEPYLKYSEYEKRMTEVIDEVEVLRAKLDEMRTAFTTAFAGSNAVMGSPIASLVGLATGYLPTLIAPLAAVQTNLRTIKTDLPLTKSERIFGE